MRARARVGSDVGGASGDVRMRGQWAAVGIECSGVGGGGGGTERARARTRTSWTVRRGTRATASSPLCLLLAGALLVAALLGGPTCQNRAARALKRGNHPALIRPPPGHDGPELEQYLIHRLLFPRKKLPANTTLCSNRTYTTSGVYLTHKSLL